ncbi:hypothetical protein CHS0354_009859 [Potamilus streckersoni]|uniref:Uncharacterized protein n=1 Tax=Potamilus streckersoni TaxID=2493646 RepID=A0AAE0SX09_9BIVA|nr:hypothetical protein CHS0354_009859 [Potamilus streckersoni]
MEMAGAYVQNVTSFTFEGSSSKQAHQMKYVDWQHKTGRQLTGSSGVRTAQIFISKKFKM